MARMREDEGLRVVAGLSRRNEDEKTTTVLMVLVGDELISRSVKHDPPGPTFVAARIDATSVSTRF